MNGSSNNQVPPHPGPAQQIYTISQVATFIQILESLEESLNPREEQFLAEMKTLHRTLAEQERVNASQVQHRPGLPNLQVSLPHHRPSNLPLPRPLPHPTTIGTPVSAVASNSAPLPSSGRTPTTMSSAVPLQRRGLAPGAGPTLNPNQIQASRPASASSSSSSATRPAVSSANSSTQSTASKVPLSRSGMIPATSTYSGSQLLGRGLGLGAGAPPMSRSGMIPATSTHSGSPLLELCAGALPKWDQNLANVTITSQAESPSSLKQHFDDSLSCPVCLENFVGDKTPKDLDCPHVCCQDCLGKIPRNDSSDLICPQCNGITKMPPGGVPALKTNLVVRSLAEKLEDHRKANKSKRCEIHDEQEIFFFCKTCNTPICQYCILSNHLRHTYEPIKLLVMEQKEKLKCALQKAYAQINTYLNNSRQIKQNEEKLISKFSSAEVKIAQQVQASKDEADKKGQELKDKLQRWKAVALEKVQKEKQSTEESFHAKRQIYAKAQNTYNQSSDVEYLRMHDQCLVTMNKFIEDNLSTTANVQEVESGFKLEVGLCNVNLGLNLMPQKVLGDINCDMPSTSRNVEEGPGGQVESSIRTQFPVFGNTDTPLTKRRKGDDEEENEMQANTKERKRREKRHKSHKPKSRPAHQ